LIGVIKEQRSRVRKATGIFLVFLVFVVSLVFAAVGSTSSTARSAVSTIPPIADADPAWLKQAKRDVTAGYGTGLIQRPPKTGPRAQKGKRVWWISCGRTQAGCVQQDTEFLQAAKSLGWKVFLLDGKESPLGAAGLIRQAVTAKVDAVGIAAFDCAVVKSALETAKRAKIPVVSYAGYDCNPSLYAAMPKIVGSTNPNGLWNLFGKLMAQYAIASENGKGKFLFITCTEKEVCKADNRGFETAMAKCTTCEVVKVGWTFSQIPNPATQLWSSAILANPDAKAIVYLPSGIMFLGLEQAIRGAGRPINVYGAIGTPANYVNIRRGFEMNAVAVQERQHVWATADTINRLLAGVKPKDLPNQGGGVQIVDKEHNLPPEGQLYFGAFDYKTAYRKIWSGKK
jgi:ribose transport system substrate-binding protein